MDKTLKIKNYKLKEFLKLKNIDEIQFFLSILELLRPSNSIDNTKCRWWNKEPKKINLRRIKELSFAEVINIRTGFSEGSIESITESVSIVSGLDKKEVGNIKIIDFYGVISMIKEDLGEIAIMEINELSSDDFDIQLESVRAAERMEKFGALNPINSLANDDITKWQTIQEMPYMTVFTKLKMDNEKHKIQKEITELQRKKNR